LDFPSPTVHFTVVSSTLHTSSVQHRALGTRSVHFWQ